MNSKHGVGLTTRREMLQGLAMVGGGGLLSRLVPDVAYAATQDFNAMQPGSLPPGWVPVTAGGYEGGIRLPGVWERDLYGERAKELEITPSADFRIVADPTAPSGGPVLEIVNPGTDAWCVKSDVSIRDGYVEVQGKNTPQPQHIFGKSNKGPTFGVVWRYQNPKNFYCVMWDQSDLKMIKMEEGGFEVFEVSPMTRIPGDQWHTVRVEFTGHKFTALLNGEVLYTGFDSEITAAGAVGVIAIGDSKAHFDNFKYGAFPASGRADFDAMPWGPPVAPWVGVDTLDLGSPHYPLKRAMKWDIFKIRVPRDKARNVLRQSGFGLMPVCVNSSVSLLDGYVEADVMALAGQFERVGGVVFRYVDDKNYYVARSEFVEEAGEREWLVLWKVVDGKRSGIQRSPVLPNTDSHVWHSIRAEFAGDRILVYYDGKKVVSACDNAITKPGAIGVWTKLDSEARFDNLSWGEYLGTALDDLPACPPGAEAFPEKRA